MSTQGFKLNQGNPGSICFGGSEKKGWSYQKTFYTTFANNPHYVKEYPFTDLELTHIHYWKNTTHGYFAVNNDELEVLMSIEGGYFHEIHFADRVCRFYGDVDISNDKRDGNGTQLFPYFSKLSFEEIWMTLKRCVEAELVDLGRGVKAKCDLYGYASESKISIHWLANALSENADSRREFMTRVSKRFVKDFIDTYRKNETYESLIRAFDDVYDNCKSLRLFNSRKGDSPIKVCIPGSRSEHSHLIKHSFNFTVGYPLLYMEGVQKRVPRLKSGPFKEIVYRYPETLAVVLDDLSGNDEWYCKMDPYANWRYIMFACIREMEDPNEGLALLTEYSTTHSSSTRDAQKCKEKYESSCKSSMAGVNKLIQICKEKGVDEETIEKWEKSYDEEKFKQKSLNEPCLASLSGSVNLSSRGDEGTTEVETVDVETFSTVSTLPVAPDRPHRLSRTLHDFISMINKRNKERRPFKSRKAVCEFIKKEAYGCAVIIDGSPSEVIVKVNSDESPIRKYNDFVGDKNYKYLTLSYHSQKDDAEGSKEVSTVAVIDYCVHHVWDHVEKIVNVPHLPGEIPPVRECELNTFPGYKAKILSDEELDERMSELKPWIDHTKEVICNGKKKHFEYIMRFVTCLLALPRERCDNMLVIEGEYGAGKGVWLSPIRECLGTQLTVEVSCMNELFGENFTPYETSPRLVEIKELERIFRSGSTEKEYSRLKSHITDSKMRIRRMRKDPYYVDNFGMYIACTNNDETICIPPRDRRIALVKTSSIAIGRKQKYWDSIANTDPSLLLTYCLRLVDEYGGKTELISYLKRGLMNAEKRAEIRAGLPSPMQFLLQIKERDNIVLGHKANMGKFDVLECPNSKCVGKCSCPIQDCIEIDVSRDPNKEGVWVSASEIYQCYISWCAKNGINNRLTSTSFGKQISSICEKGRKLNRVQYRLDRIVIHNVEPIDEEGDDERDE